MACVTGPWSSLDAETVGPLRLDAWAYTYFVLCLPTLFILGAGAVVVTANTSYVTYKSG